MSSSRGHFVVFACAACGKRVFAEKAQVGKAGVCPLCGAKTTITPIGKSAATEKTERRRAKRVPLQNARATYETKAMAGRPLAPDEVPSIEDISETGLAFAMKGERDRKKLAGFGPPSAFRVGETISITIDVPELFRPRTLKALVRRIVPHPKNKELYRVGVEFVGATDEIKKDLRKLVEKR